MGALRIAGRAITIVVTLALARLLTPSDFGVVAIATLAISFIDTLGDQRVKPAVVLP